MAGKWMIIYQAENAAIRMCVVATCINACAVKSILKEQFI